MSVVPKEIYRLNVSTVITSVTLLGQENMIFKFILKHRRPVITKAVLNNKNKASDLTIPDFKEYSRAVINRSVWFIHKNRYADQWKRIES